MHVGIVRSSTNRRCIRIDILDDDSLLNIFYYCRPLAPLVGGDDDGVDLWGGGWECEYWWYKFSWVCRRWRRLIHASPSYLGISLVCRSGVPVADMLAHSPPLPLIIDHTHRLSSNAAEAKEGTLLDVEERIPIVLQHRDRVRRIRIVQFYDKLSEKLVEAIDEDFPLLEYLYIQPPIMTILGPNSGLSLPSNLRAPHLRHLVLFGYAFPMGSPFLAGLVTLSLQDVNPSSSLAPNKLLQQLSLMSRLETFVITFRPALSSQNVMEKSWQIPLSTQCTLPNLRWFGFEGRSAYMEAVLPRISMPLLRITEILSSPSNTFDLASSILFTLQTMYKTENPRLFNVKVRFYEVPIILTMYPQQSPDMPTLRVEISRLDLKRNLDYMAQTFDGIRTVLTEVEMLTLEDEQSWGVYRRVEFQTRLRKILEPFIQVRTLHLSGGDFIEELCCFLLPHDGESTIELLPMLRVLSCPKVTHVGESCRSFLAARQNAGFPVTIAYH